MVQIRSFGMEANPIDLKSAERRRKSDRKAEVSKAGGPGSLRRLLYKGLQQDLGLPAVTLDIRMWKQWRLRALLKVPWSPGALDDGAQVLRGARILWGPQLRMSHSGSFVSEWGLNDGRELISRWCRVPMAPGCLRRGGGVPP
ncbi:hypothetical protein NDU88_000471 [Pleurodeles waltl]|uniref:Uncharacterized protein n=1 Tax=Pleurodeles waltl TaxID=8319 RepID=A0AAV7L6L1_PLEWA|nr:hypothetical protein NDU88_000471 [Pleurodeles waltl]